MKKLMVLLIVCVSFLLYAPTAYASGDPCENKYLSKIVNDCSPHTIDTDTDTHRDKNDFAVGGGLDFFLWKSEKFDIASQTKYDSINNNGSAYVVLQIKSEQGLLQNVGGFLKTLFNKGE